MPKFSFPEAQTVGFMIALIGVISMEAYDLVSNGKPPQALPNVLMLAAGLFYAKATASGANGGPNGGANA